MAASPANRVAPSGALALVLALAPAFGIAADRAADPLGGKPLNAKLERLDGGKLKLSDLTGQPLLLELWATWCGPCRRQSEIVLGLEEELAARGIAVLAVNEGETSDLVESFVADHPGPFPVALDRWQAVATRLSIGDLPALVLLDASGRVAGIRSGLTERDELLALLTVLEGTP